MTKAEDRAWEHDIASSLGERIARLEGELIQMIGEADLALAIHAQRLAEATADADECATFARPLSVTLH